MSDTKREDGGPAFPVVHAIAPQPGHYTSTPPAIPGMTLRDYFAAKAMQGILASYAGLSVNLPTYEKVAREAFLYSDEMLRALES
jgi:hypothetical protein